MQVFNFASFQYLITDGSSRKEGTSLDARQSSEKPREKFKLDHMVSGIAPLSAAVDIVVN